MDKRYSYGITGVTDEKALVSGIKKQAGVVDCYVEDGKLIYVLDEHADEYAVFVEANDLCAKYDGMLTYEDGPDEGAAGEEPADGADDVQSDGDQTDDEGEVVEDGAVFTTNGQTKRKSIFDEEEDDYNEVDKIVSKKKKFKQEAWIRAGELIVSAVLFAVCLILPGETNEFGFKTILGVLAFAIGGYEVFYAAITDLMKKKFLSENVIITLAAVMGALLGYVLETTALVVAFAAAKVVESIADGITDGKIEETFYTGSVRASMVGGGDKNIEDIAVGDELALGQFDVVPCDGVAGGEAVLDTYRVSALPETTVKAGDPVYAGSVVLSDKLNVTVEKTNAESALTVEKKNFADTLAGVMKIPQWLVMTNVVCLVGALLMTFLMPLILGGDYATGLRLWGARAIAVIAITMVCYAFFVAVSCVRNAMVTSRYRKIKFAGESSLNKLAGANEFVFLSSVMTENGQIKEDVYGCMNELLSLGVKNVRTEFDNHLDEAVKAKLKFKQKQVDEPRTIVVGKDVTFGGDGEVDIAGGELSFLPLAYKMAKRAGARKNLIFVVKAISLAACVAALVFVPAATFSPIYFGAISAAITALFTILALLSTRKAD